jgi:hypothetical protein
VRPAALFFCFHRWFFGLKHRSVPRSQSTPHGEFASLFFQTRLHGSKKISDHFAFTRQQSQRGKKQTTTKTEMGLAARCRFGAHVAVAILTTALLFSVSEAVSVTFVNSSYVYADSEFYRVVLTHANLTMYYRNRRGNIPGDKVEVSFSSFAEQYRWGTTPNASGSEATYGTVCTDSFSSGEYIFNHVTYVIILRIILHSDSEY